MSIANFKHLSISGFFDHLFEPSFDTQGRFKSAAFKLKHKSRIGSNKEQSEFCIMISDKSVYESLKAINYGTYLYCIVYLPKKDSWILDEFSTIPLDTLQPLVNHYLNFTTPNIHDMAQSDVEEYWYSHWYKIKTEILPLLNQKLSEIENNNSINKKITEIKKLLEE